QDLFDRRALVWRRRHLLETIEYVALHLPHGVGGDRGRQERPQRPLQDEDVAPDARLAGLGERHRPSSSAAFSSRSIFFVNSRQWPVMSSSTRRPSAVSW